MLDPEAQTDRWPPNPRVTLVVAFCLLLATADVYLPTCFYGFLSWDDPFHIVHNEHFTKPGGPNIGFFWRNYVFALYRPLIYTIWGLTARAARLPHPHNETGLGLVAFDAGAFHTLNVAVHCVNVLLVFMLLRKLLGKGQNPLAVDLASGAGALLFGLHPVQAESVAWITGGNASIFGLFGLLFLHAYVAHAESAREGARRRTIAYYTAATICYVLALLTYPVAVALPFTAWAIDRWALGRPTGQGFRAVLPWIVLAAPATLVTVAVRHP
jgi:hypothetical protein